MAKSPYIGEIPDPEKLSPKAIRELLASKYQYPTSSTNKDFLVRVLKNARKRHPEAEGDSK